MRATWCRRSRLATPTSRTTRSARRTRPARSMARPALISSRDGLRPIECLMRVSSRDRREAGFTLVELMIAIMILLVGVLGSVALVDGANRTTAANKGREGATNVARDVIEALHNF